MMYFYSLFTNIVFGISLVSLLVFLPNRKSSACLIVSLGILVGMLGLGALYGIIALFFRPFYSFLPVLDTILMAGVFIAAWRTGGFTRLVRSIGRSKSISRYEFIAILYVIYCCGILITKLYLSPTGGWDAWAMWNLKARTLASTQGDVAITMLNGYAHSDYPLLLPYINARAFQALGTLSTIAPQVTMFLFCMSFWGIFVSTAALLKKRSSLYLAIGIIFPGPYLPSIFSSQYADGPLTAVFTALLGVTLLNEIYRNNTDGQNKYHISFILHGILFGSLCMIKNEGLMLSMCFLIGYVVTRFQHRQLAAIPKDVCYMFFGIFIFALLFVTVKIRYPLENDLITISIVDRFKYFFDISRYKLIAQFIFKEIFSMHWLLLPIILSIFPFVFGFDRTLKKANTIIFLPLVIGFAGYIAIYFLTPHDLNWHLSTSLDRIMAHLTPAFLLYLITITDFDIKNLPGNHT
jgi:hypothetical protein